MQQRTLLQLVQPSEPDYVEHFHTLAKLNVEISQYGPTWQRLLRKSILEMDVGNFAAGLQAAQDTIDLRPECPEAHFQEGMAFILLAFQKAGALAASAGSEAPPQTARSLLVDASRSFSAAAGMNPDDEESSDDVAALALFLTQHKDEETVDEALRDMWQA